MGSEGADDAETDGLRAPRAVSSSPPGAAVSTSDPGAGSTGRPAVMLGEPGPDPTTHPAVHPPDSPDRDPAPGGEPGESGVRAGESGRPDDPTAPDHLG